MESQSAATVAQSQLTSLSENEAATHAAVQQAIIDTLLESIPTALMPEALQVVPIFDRQFDRYQLLCQGWTEREKRIFYPILHIEIIDRKVWIQHNQSDLDVGEALAQRGIPKSQIVLGLHPPSVRQLNETYAAG